MSFNPESICFIASKAPNAQEALQILSRRYGQRKADNAEVIVVIGGDGTMLRALHKFMNSDKKLYGMNRGSVGFLMNEYHLDKLPQRIECATLEVIHPLHMLAKSTKEGIVESLGINEVSLFRQSYQAAKIQISVDNKIRIPELVCDGILVATPLGSTAYNLSAQGPILPLISPLIALTPVSPFRPRRWHGALLSNEKLIEFKILEPNRRPVNAAADNRGVKTVEKVTIRKSQNDFVNLLFDSDHSWDERILTEQFDISR
ncbi:NAD kinase [Bartonella sp. DGB1]|uniref:NAD kinase n=1 Tax=Bartonella sp. DGB1 TaxID=3239807 RepID=UPI0035255B42